MLSLLIKVIHTIPAMPIKVVVNGNSSCSVEGNPNICLISRIN